MKTLTLIKSMMTVVMANAEATIELCERLEQEDLVRHLQEAIDVAGMEPDDETSTF